MVKVRMLISEKGKGVKWKKEKQGRVLEREENSMEEKVSRGEEYIEGDKNIDTKEKGGMKKVT